MRANVKMLYSGSAYVSICLTQIGSHEGPGTCDLSTKIVDHHYYIHYNTLQKNGQQGDESQFLAVEGVSVGKLQNDHDREQRREGIRNPMYSLIHFDRLDCYMRTNGYNIRMRADCWGSPTSWFSMRIC